MGNNIDVYMERQRALFEAVGQAMTRWAMLEAQLLVLFARAANITPHTAAVIFKPVKSFDAALKIIDGVVKNRLPKGEVEAWGLLRNKIKALSIDRNYAAHSPVSSTPPEHPSLTDWASVIPEVGKNLGEHLLGQERHEPMRLEDMHRLFEGLEAAESEVFQLSERIREMPPSRA